MTYSNNPQQTTSYQQFQQQLEENRKMQMQQAQAAIAKTGADNFSSQVRQVILKLQNLRDELQQSQNQLESQMDASRRQLQRNQDSIGQIEQQLSDLFLSGTKTHIQ
ncbi:hypothetical protein [Gorillibacterium massiliense]|uniref:hypothetical protein n=1 Tax=Gorillibacterium massiliense TaxID=1280390 RepID=UPI0012DD08AE|nr:hypothetical protein [Gorillibacterium massiliense]